MTMKHPIIKNISSEYILTQSKVKRKSFKIYSDFFSENYKKLNVYFGIEKNVSDQICFYGFYGVSIIILLFIYLIVGL
ncbi:DUF3961 domain-containing protein [Bacillus cereus]|uniref:DUF3961 domain-containing protein n=1 Tax=Bacillus cereus TaxID=1396 RepID=UPI002815C5AF|nr:DUF3961 domain-containing protein [Bacillus cereus]